MTLKSKREIERALDDLDDGGGSDTEIIIRDTVVETGWSGDEAVPGTVVDEERTVVEL